MEIHKPKAAHSIRQLITEIGTIICGILIALGLEQAVEVGHRQHEVQEARRPSRKSRTSALWRRDRRRPNGSCPARRLVLESTHKRLLLTPALGLVGASTAVVDR